MTAGACVDAIGATASRPPLVLAAAAGAFTLLVAAPAAAYIGPGAGFAFLTSFFLLFATVLLTALALLTWPIRQVVRRLRTRRPPLPARVRRAVVIGLDGLDPAVARELMAAGRMPNLRRLAEQGCFSELATTCPAISPVAWSTFSTGVHPAKHAIFDFLGRDRRTYEAKLSSVEIRPPSRHLQLGHFRLPLGRPTIRMLRRSEPFWKRLADHRVPCSILRVPITFPAEPFSGTSLSAMCVPDLRGTQGSFTLLSAAPEDEESRIGGQVLALTGRNGELVARLTGPQNPFREGELLDVPLTVQVSADRVVLRVARQRHELARDRYTPWIELPFSVVPGVNVRGLVRFRLLDREPVRIYATPLQIDPASPALPISHPRVFSVFLAKLMGSFATLGLAEDTWALNEGVIDGPAFLEQLRDHQQERERMLLEMIDRTRRGLVACVFDGTDRGQHMFFRDREVIEDLYAEADALLGRVFERVDPADPDNLLLVLSDHGFARFDFGVNLNTWLLDNGYLVLEEGREECGEWLQGVDWGRTRAYALGLAGLYLNVAGREARGTVAQSDAAALREEIAGGLEGLKGPEGAAIRRVIDPRRLHRGPYLEQAPDLIVGYARGFRASWDGARGMSRAGAQVIEPNTRRWNGDHCIDPDLVPGVVACNRPLRTAGAGIVDIAPTLLEAFGVPAPRHMDGHCLLET